MTVQGKHQNKPPLPYVPGNELAGHVVALGDGVTNVAIGDRVGHVLCTLALWPIERRG